MKASGRQFGDWFQRVASPTLALCICAALGAPRDTLAHDAQMSTALLEFRERAVTPANRSSSHLGTSAADGKRTARKSRLKRQCRRAGVTDVAQCVDQLRLAKAATARYRDPQQALSDGYMPLTQCEHSASGAMGEHWIRTDLVVDQALDPGEPEMLLYLDAPTGRRLIGVEWSMNALEAGLPHYGTAPPDAARTPAAPAMFGGRVFEGPMQGHNMVALWDGEFHVTPQPWHYDLHVWLWERNPAGIFAQYNPNLSCG